MRCLLLDQSSATLHLDDRAHHLARQRGVEIDGRHRPSIDSEVEPTVLRLLVEHEDRPDEAIGGAIGDHDRSADVVDAGRGHARAEPRLGEPLFRRCRRHPTHRGRAEHGALGRRAPHVRPRPCRRSPATRSTAVGSVASSRLRRLRLVAVPASAGSLSVMSPRHRRWRRARRDRAPRGRVGVTCRIPEGGVVSRRGAARLAWAGPRRPALAAQPVPMPAPRARPASVIVRSDSVSRSGRSSGSSCSSSRSSSSSQTGKPEHLAGDTDRHRGRAGQVDQRLVVHGRRPTTHERGLGADTRRRAPRSTTPPARRATANAMPHARRRARSDRQRRHRTRSRRRSSVARRLSLPLTVRCSRASYGIARCSTPAVTSSVADGQASAPIIAGSAWLRSARDERVGAGRLRRLGSRARQLGADGEPRLVDEHFDRRRARHRTDVELVLQCRHETLGNRDRILGRGVHAVGLGHDDVADAVRCEQAAGV